MPARALHGESLQIKRVGRPLGMRQRWATCALLQDQAKRANAQRLYGKPGDGAS
jgi:hypothetical protein